LRTDAGERRFYDNGRREGFFDDFPREFSGEMERTREKQHRKDRKAQERRIRSHPTHFSFREGKFFVLRDAEDSLHHNSEGKRDVMEFSMIFTRGFLSFSRRLRGENAKR
jgi:hypothetical protein